MREIKPQTVTLTWDDYMELKMLAEMPQTERERSRIELIPEMIGVSKMAVESVREYEKIKMIMSLTRDYLMARG